MTLAGLFALTALFYASWTLLGWWRARGRERGQLLRHTAGALVLPSLLGLHTLQEERMWTHLTFPFTLVIWGALLIVYLLAGLVQLARRRPANGWPLLGVPVAVLFLAVFVALLGVAQGGRS